MKIVRHCKERLPHGEKFWRALAREAGFNGTLEVIGYGVGNSSEAVSHRKYAGRKDKQMVIGYIILAKNLIKVFCNSSCATIREAMTNEEGSLHTFAHELGHFYADKHNIKNTERYANMYARRALSGKVERGGKTGTTEVHVWDSKQSAWKWVLSNAGQGTRGERKGEGSGETSASDSGRESEQDTRKEEVSGEGK